MSEENCLCKGNNVFIYACSGGSNVGQIANQAAIELTQEGAGKMSCIVGVSGHVSGMIASTKAAKRIVAIDGCPVKCVQKTLVNAKLYHVLHLNIPKKFL